MREGWEKVILDDICETINGLWTGKKGPYIDVDVYTMTNFTKESELNHTKSPRKITASIFQFEKRKLVYGDILIEKSGGGPNQPVGRAVYFDIKNNENNTFSNFTTRLRIIPSQIKSINSKYIQKYLKCIYIIGGTEKFQKNSTNIRNLQLKEYLKLQIPIPPLQEQKQIIDILDQAFAAIDQAKANIEKNIENAKELFQSKLNKVFSQRGDGWEEKKLNEICEVKDGTHDSPKYVDEDTGIPFVTQKNILDNGLSFDKVKYISKSDHDNFYRRSNVAFNDILFSMIGANRGMACIVDDKRVFSIKNVGLIKSNNSYRAKFLLYFLKSPVAKDYVLNNSSGSAQGFIGLGKLRAFPVPITDIDTQKNIELQLDSLNDLKNDFISKLNMKLKSLEELKKSILQKAFSGELTNKENGLT